MATATVERNGSDLLAAARAGDAAALDALLRRHEARIYRFSMKMCRQPEDAQDVLQDTLLAMARSLRDFRGGSSVSTWLYTIARSFCIKKRRKRKHAPRTLLSLEHEALRPAAIVRDPALGPDDAVAGMELERLVQAAIGALEHSQREVLVLRDVEGLPAAQVAQVLGVSTAAVKSRLHRARAALRARVAPALGVPLRRGRRRRGCPDVIRSFSRHLEGDLSAGVCAAMERHLAQCRDCLDECDSLKRTLGVCRASAAPRVPRGLQNKIRAGIRNLLAAERR